MSQEDHDASDAAAEPTPAEKVPVTSAGKAESRFVRALRSLLLVWAAGIAPILIAALAVLQFVGPPPEVKIQDLKTLIAVLEKANASIRDGTFGAVSATDRQLLAEKASNLDRVVTTTFGARPPNLDPFVLKQNQSLDLLQPNGTTTPISVGRIYAVHSYLYVTVDGVRRQLYVGERMTFGPRRNPCTVTLRAIDEPRLEGSFDFRCQ